ncbi:MAG: DUF2834 domain-containing protein [Cardiobacteriaceae bacterium]|nr:DUF2834 domain-containing protein [Cardiobacteriaceae bacterium]
MKREHFYLLLCLLGTALPLAAFLPWLGEHGLNLPLLAVQAFATPLSAFAWLDVLVSAAATIAFVLWEGRRIAMPRPWLALLGLGVGVSLALPLFLWMRERHMRNFPTKKRLP